MRLRPEQLAAHLKQGLAPVYLVTGDEPLQLGEAAQEIRAAARQGGYLEREILDAEPGFAWYRLEATARTMSLFSARKLIELRLPGTSLGREGAPALAGYCAKPPPDNLLLILGPALEAKEQKAKWVNEVDRAGVVLVARPPQGQALVQWLDRRMQQRGLALAPGVAALLAERVEGNLVAAAQEVEKLRLLYGAGPLDEARLVAAIADSARFNVFALGDAALRGDRARVARILDGLAAEGEAQPLVLWALTRELRLLAAVAFGAREGGRGLTAALEAQRVWESRRGLVTAAVRRLPLARLHGLLLACAEIDRQIKGQAPGDPWLGLARVADGLAGAPR